MNENAASRSGIVMLTVASIALAACATKFPAVAELPPQPGLPDPLVTQSGKKVATAEQWRNERRPELAAMFQHYMYGHLPTAPEKMSAKVERVNPNYFGGAATKSEVTLKYGPPDCPPLHLLLITPNAKKPAPVFLCLNFHGNQAVLKDPDIALATGWQTGTIHKEGVVSNHVTDAGRGVEESEWMVERTIKRGYAFATFHNADIEPDRTNAVEGTRALYPQCDWGAIAAWAWGFHRAVDYLVTNPNIDAKKIAIMGHSRNGKAALLAGALDERIAMVFPHQAGCGGTAPSRHTIGSAAAGYPDKVEAIKRINTSFPHWFNAEFKTFLDTPEKLPFDQHELLALCAPRPVLYSTAVDDRWANPPGQFEMMKAASPVYRLLGATGLDTENFPETNKPSLGGTLGYYHRDGKHATTAEDWAVFLDFADNHLAR